MNSNTSNLALSIRHLSVMYDDKVVLKNVSLDIEKGKLLAIVGPNGAGKSTLVKAVLGIVPSVTGSFSIFGNHIDKMRKNIAYMPQRENIDWDFPVNVFDVVLMGTYGDLGWFKRTSSLHKQRAMDSIRAVGLEGFENRQISELSGGQQQRTFLARALAQNADVYFMDEPFAGVDIATENTIMSTLYHIKKEGKTVIAVHHNLDTVQKYFDDVVIINENLIASGDVSSVLNTTNLTKAYGKNFHSSYLKSLGPDSCAPFPSPS